MFGFIKNIFGGIMAFFGGILGIGKKSKEDKSNAPKTRKGRGYYLELDESQAAQTGNGSKPAQAEAVKVESAPKAEPAKVAEAVAAAPAPVAPAPAPKPQPAKAEAAPKPEAVKAAAPVAKANAKSEPQAPSTFAPNYLLTLSSTNGRRRPGANMSSFLDMARQVKTSK
ncbi:hypothetical protein H6S82_06535 [Planktothrix sp. FACHB-1355]|uniref:Uncharacterized protein n=1 Tax=Aerosakkonema funiforme FACHB-1375 TaxID=2949571 RepID=A0A926ZJC4_9CYAN|nr:MULTISPECIES: hypothetical protein [Oscillatoriales]MBD2182766.1 hypothetical protein [Aerosakkonema funiforme FACHB-1375]MBD3558512.1 hypothetical protein [Planktothrix sp. FACHB-1355]